MTGHESEKDDWLELSSTLQTEAAVPKIFFLFPYLNKTKNQMSFQ